MSNSADDFSKLKSGLISKLKDELPVLRAKGKFSQESIAEKIGISRQTYSGIETGRREMTWTTFLALVALFQNNEQTKQLIDKMDGFNEEMIEIMESSEKRV